MVLGTYLWTLRERGPSKLGKQPYAPSLPHGCFGLSTELKAALQRELPDHAGRFEPWSSRNSSK